MKKLFTIDLKDYDPNWEKLYRPSVRGIIFDQNNHLAMIYSRKLHFYKFPGGGVEGSETHLETLAREIKEETGLTLIPESAKAFGEVLKIQKSDKCGKNIIHIQRNYYYACSVKCNIKTQNLDDDEKELDFVLKFVPIDEAIKANISLDTDDNSIATCENHESLFMPCQCLIFAGIKITDPGCKLIAGFGAPSSSSHS